MNLLKYLDHLRRSGTEVGFANRDADTVPSAHEVDIAFRLVLIQTTLTFTLHFYIGSHDSLLLYRLCQCQRTGAIAYKVHVNSNYNTANAHTGNVSMAVGSRSATIPALFKYIYRKLVATFTGSPGYQPSREQALLGDLHTIVVIVIRDRILKFPVHMNRTRLYRKWKGYSGVFPWDSQRRPLQEIVVQYVPISCF